jgi:hypothetical protein
MSKLSIRWHPGWDEKDRFPQPGIWYAEVQGERIAWVQMDPRIHHAYYGRYKGEILGVKVMTTYLKDFKDETKKRWEESQKPGE